MDISIKEIVCTTIDENGRIVRKDTLENRFEKLDEFSVTSLRETALSWNQQDSMNHSTTS